MKKRSPIITVALLVMSAGIFGAIFYVNNLLNGKNETPVTQIKKTKASAQTYHKLLALNDIEITPIDNDTPENVTPTPTDEPDAPTSTPEPTKEVALPSPTKVVATLIPTKSPTLTLAPTGVSPTVAPPTLVPTKQSLLLAYRNPSPTITQGLEITQKQEITKKPTVVPTKTQTLPETGWAQTPLILFIVASSTILLSLLF